MSESTNKKSIIFFVTLAIVSIIITAITAVVSNKTNIGEEAIAKVIVGEREAPTTSQTGSVTVKYVDKEGKELASSDTLTGSVGSEYKAVRKDIATYAPYGAEPINKAGNYEAEEQEVKFVYQKEDSSVDVSEENNTVTIKTFHSKNTKEYDVKIITKDESGNLIKNVVYNVTDAKGKTFRNGKVQGDVFVVGTLTIAEEGKDTYKVEEDAKSYYEKLEDVDIDFTVNKIWNSQTNEFEITLDYANDLDGVTFELTDSEIIINITNKEKEVENIFDLAIEKYVQKVVVKENGKITNEFTTNESNKNNVIKVDIAKSKVNKMSLEITYKIIVKNVGNVSGYATEITDYLPEEFNYLSGGQWKVDGNKVTTNELEDIILNSGDEKELEITAEWKLNENNIGLKENKVEITEYKNDLDLEDKTPDNIDTAPILATVKTGGAELPVGSVLLVLNVLAIAVYVVKIKKSGKEKCKHEK